MYVNEGFFPANGVTGNTIASAAAAGIVGETTEQSRAFASATGATTATTLNVTASNISLTQGWWRVSGAIGFSPATTTSITVTQGGISLTSATLPAASTLAVPSSGGEYRTTFGFPSAVLGNQNDVILALPVYEFYVSSTTNYYLVARATFTVSTLAVYGWYRAVRFR